jgi:hypothetical protein
MRRSIGAKSNSSALHSVGIGALLESREVVVAQPLSLIRRSDAPIQCEISGLDEGGDSRWLDPDRDFSAVDELVSCFRSPLLDQPLHRTPLPFVKPVGHTLPKADEYVDRRQVWGGCKPLLD